MDVSTFRYLCSYLAPDLQRQNMNMRVAILVHMKVVVSISRLAIGNFMQCIADLYKIGFSSNQLGVSQIYVVIKIIFFQKIIKWSSSTIMDRYVQEFQDLHQILYVVGAVDGSHTLIVASRLHVAENYNRKIFHSIML